ncbi:cobalt ECF transporter T component CbiQ [Paenibacillus sp. UNC451MF]|uniref:cobalt ECF transporter T component CbiQ n=1 Tax=Paenibacillus sp. UNC451MF TaxID=1449063 RepID=UPI00048E8582|nr:cobalt ECF transporter T component CbiQ [Paenibacillus sp. UNC451MF]
MIRQIDVISYSNELRAVSPMWKSGFAALLILLSYMSHPIVQLLLFVWISIWIAAYAKVPLTLYFLLLCSSLLLFVTSLPAILLEIHSLESEQNIGHGLVLISYSHWTLYLNPTGLQLAVKLFCRIIACLSASLLLILTTPMSELFQVMKKLRMPSLVLEIMLITYRFLFLLLDTAHDMYMSQRARGGQQGFKGRLKDTAILIVRMFAKTMQRYQGLANGMVSRGFTEDIQMAPYQSKHVPRRYIWESCIGVVMLIALECWLRWRDMG